MHKSEVTVPLKAGGVERAVLASKPTIQVGPSSYKREQCLPASESEHR